MPGASLTARLACALFKQETVVGAAAEALVEILAEKKSLNSKLVQKTDEIADLNLQIGSKN